MVLVAPRTVSSARGPNGETVVPTTTSGKSLVLISLSWKIQLTSILSVAQHQPTVTADVNPSMESATS